MNGIVDFKYEQYNNVFGKEEADILVVGCDPTIVKERGRQTSLRFPFDLKRNDAGIIHYCNPFFCQIFRNLCVILGVEPVERDADTQKIFAERICVTNAVGEPVFVEGVSGERRRLETKDSLPLGDIENSPWWKTFIKDQKGGSWKDRICRIAAEKIVYITSELLVKPLLKEGCREEAGRIRKEVRQKNETSSQDYRNYHIPGKMNILDTDVYFLYRHYAYRLRD